MRIPTFIAAAALTRQPTVDPYDDLFGAEAARLQAEGWSLERPTVKYGTTPAKDVSSHE